MLSKKPRFYSILQTFILKIIKNAFLTFFCFSNVYYVRVMQEAVSNGRTGGSDDAAAGYGRHTCRLSVICIVR